MLTGIAVGTGIMLTYLALFGLAGRKLRSIDEAAESEHSEAAAALPRDRR